MKRMAGFYKWNMSDMAIYGAIIVMVTLFTHTICAPQVMQTGININNTFKTPANLSYEELVYIIQFKNGEDRIPPKTLSPCARAILGCCKGKVMNENCSETLGCGAFFFDDNPCEDKFIKDALKAARTFYDQFNKVTT